MLNKYIENNIVDKYLENYDKYWECRDKFETLIEYMLEENNIRFHSINSRIKEKQSLKQKLRKGNGKYKTIDDVTDLIGIRIITYFADDVDEVAKIIKKEFYVDKKNSIDKRELLDPDRFGYLSLHYVVSLSENMRLIPDYQNILDFKVEIQIRSILQHTWAEIEHDLGYKSKYAIPRDIRRSFSRIAGLLEIADDEFIRIREDLDEYESKVYEKILSAPDKVLIDQASLKSYIANSKTVRKINEEIANITGVKISSNDKILFSDFEIVKYLNFKTINELHEALTKYNYEIIEFAKRWILKKQYRVLYPGIPIYYLGFILEGKSKSQERICKYLKDNSIGSSYEEDAYEINMICREIEGEDSL